MSINVKGAIHGYTVYGLNNCMMVVATDFFFCTKSLNHFSNTLCVISFNFSRHFLCVHLTELFYQNSFLNIYFFL